jgi:hypothetical protein
MKLPEITERLRTLAVKLNCEELNQLANEIGRRPSGTRAPATSATMTYQLREEIRAFAAANPGMSQAKIGARFNVNPGRVSEALKGKRT